MARGAIDAGVAVLDSIDLSQVIKDDVVVHVHHVPGNLLGWFVVFFPLACNVTVGATYAESTAVTHLHNLQQIPRGDASQDLYVLEHGFRWLVFLAGNLLGKCRDAVIIELLDGFWGSGFVLGNGRFFLRGVGYPESEQ